MPLPEDVARLLRDQRFWLDYFSFSPSRPHTGLEAEIRLPVTGQHALALSINGGLRCQLGLSVDGGEPILLGWDDDAHWHPHVLRWAEVCRASAAIAARAPSLPHPGIPLLLLARFAPICSEEDARFAWALLGAAANRVTPRSARIRLRAFDRVDVRGAQLEWRKADVGMVLEQPGTPSLTRPMLYTLRSHDSEAFPFAEWRAMLQDLPEATRPPPPGPVPATQAQVRFQLQHSSGLPHQEVSRIEAYLSRVLEDAGEGRSG